MASAAFRMTCRHDFVAGTAFLKRMSKFAKASCNLLILDLQCADFVAGAALCESRCADSWQAQHFVNLDVQSAWQAQHFVNLDVQISWQAQHFVNLDVQIS